MEYGIVIPQGISYVRKQLPRILEAADNGLSDLFRELLHHQYEELVHLDERIEVVEKKLLTRSIINCKQCQNDAQCSGTNIK